MGEVLDGVVSKVLNSSNKPEEVVLSVSKSEILLLTSAKREVSLNLVIVIRTSNMKPPHY